MKKPDRLERMVDAYGFVESWAGDSKIYKSDVVKLLRQQHKAVVKMAKDIQCHQMLARLEKHAR